MITTPAFKDRKYAILGLARSGLSAARSLVAGGAQILAWDNDEAARAKVADIATIADPLLSDLSGYDAIVVSPGVPINRHPIAEKAQEEGLSLIGDMELFAMARPNLPPHRVVGITGTNGKSTTTALTGFIFEQLKIASKIGGNIGIACFELPQNQNDFNYILEVSSYQLDLITNTRFNIACLLNITPDHIDRHGSFDNYIKMER